MAPIAGVGYLIANDVLTDVAFAVIQNSVNTSVPAGGILTGTRTVAAWDPCMYTGAQILVGVVGGNLEVVTITAVVAGASFTATFANAHNAGEPIVGATFPVRQPTDQLFTQAEMLQYLSQAVNDFLGDCPLVLQVTDALSVAPTQQNVALPADCQKPVRVSAFGTALRESSQSNLDAMDYEWQQESPLGPYAYFRDKVGLQTLGVWPRANNTTPLDIVYEQRGVQAMGLGDGFILPDPFLIYVKYRVLEYACSKDGEYRNPGLAKYYAGRYAMGVKISSIFLEVVQDQNLQLAQ